jgi:hypothetical protein
LMKLLSLTTAAVALLALGARLAAADGEEAADFACSLCNTFFQQVDERTHQPIRQWDALKDFVQTSGYCRGAAAGRFNPCEIVVPALDRLPTDASSDSLYQSSRAACVQLQLCADQVIFNVPGANDAIAEAMESTGDRRHEKRTSVKITDRKEPRPTVPTGTIHDVRVSLGHGSRGANWLRLSYIDNKPRTTPHSQEFLDFFDYNEPFKYYWTEKTIHSTVRPFANGSATTTYAMGDGFNITVRLPKIGGGVRGFLFGDPCFAGEWVGCRHAEEFDIFNRLTSLLNAALVKDADMWVLLGDNFYDPLGILAPHFMQALTVEAKSQPLVSVPGNHDLWQYGQPGATHGTDTYGNGYMQYYVSDSTAAVQNFRSGSHSPFDFSVDPTTKQVAAVGNFFTYNLIGNLGIIAFNGANSREVSDPLFVEACHWVGSVKPKYVFLIGHWSGDASGCAEDMCSPKVHARLITLDGCKEMADRIKWFEGHQHCNIIVKEDTGFRMGAFGMGGCRNVDEPNFGIPFFETTDDGQLTIGYFPIAGGNGTVPLDAEGNPCPEDQSWDNVFNCIKANGIDGCRHLSVTWHHQE